MCLIWWSYLITCCSNCVWLLAHLKKLTLTWEDVVAEPRGYTKSQQNVNEDYFEEWKYVLEMNVTHLL